MKCLIFQLAVENLDIHAKTFFAIFYRDFRNVLLKNRQYDNESIFYVVVEEMEKIKSMNVIIIALHCFCFLKLLY